MLAALMFGPNRLLGGCFRAACVEVDELYIYKILDRYPTSYELAQLVNVFSPDIIFLDVTSKTALSVAQEALAIRPTAAIIGFAERCEGELSAEARRAGINEILVAPFTGEDLHQSIRRIFQEPKPDSSRKVVAFLPAKAGSGSTTIALNTAGRLARDRKQKVLLIEADVNSAILNGLLNLAPDYSIIDALENCHWLDREIWSKLCSNVEGIDILTAPTGLTAARLVEWNCRRLLNFAERLYDHVIVDLSDVTTEAAAAIMTEAKQVYIVCTPELPSLRLARRRLQDLEARGVSGSRLHILLNRHTSRDPKVQEIEEMLGKNVSAVLPSDYWCVQKAMRSASLVAEDSKLGRAFKALASELVDTDLPDSPGLASTLSRIFLRA